jgi:hypothetical protein
MNKRLAVIGIIVLLLTPLVTLQSTIVNAQSGNQAPKMAWQKVYGGSTFVVSNLIQTNDSGYVFMDGGWQHSISAAPATIYKLDSLGNQQWNKTINYFEAWLNGSAIIQTSDDGYESVGYWLYNTNSPYASGSIGNATIIKTDFQGNIQWSENYTNIPSLGTNLNLQTYSNGAHSTAGSIKTSDEGYVNWKAGTITKTSSQNSTQWVLNLTYATIDSPNGTATLGVFSIIETSDGALAILGVGYRLLDNDLTGKIYLYKTDSFLPSPSPTQLPNPISTAIPPASKPISSLLIIAVTLTILVIIGIGLTLLLYRRHRKTAS